MTDNKSYQERQQEKLVAAIQRYVDREWPVFPCKPNKQPYTPNGFHDATTNIDQIVEWWAQHPTALIGVPTGPRSGFWVVDIDMKKGKDGLATLLEYTKARNGEWSDKWLAQKTPTGGYHLLFKWDDKFPVHNRASVIRKDSGVDIRGDGGYIIVAPSAIGSEEYKWNNIEHEIPDAPQWARDLAATTAPSAMPEHPHGATDLEQIYAEGIHEGARDDTLFRVASSLRAKDVDYHTALFVMRRLGERCIPYDDEVKQMVVAKLNNAYGRYEPKTAKELKAHIDDVERREFDELLARQAKKAELRRLIKEYENDKDK
jgi:hypothetical protein